MIISMRVVGYEGGGFAVELTVSGLSSEEEAKRAMAHMEKKLCGEALTIN